MLFTTPPLPPTRSVQAEPPRAGVRTDSAEAQASELLLRAAGSSPGASPAPARELSAIGPAVVPFLYDVLVQGGVPLRSNDSERPHVVEIPPELEDAVLSALEQFPRTSVLAALRASCGSSELRPRETALRVMGRIATKEELDLVASCAGSVGSEKSVPPSIRDAFEAALTAVLEREPDAYPVAAGLYARVPPALVFPLLRALEHRPSARAIEALASFLGVRPEADMLLLAELTRLGDAVGVPPEPETAQRTRKYLAESDAKVVRAAAGVAGALEDYDAVPRLTRLLDHFDEGVSRSARSALRKIARKDLGKRPEAWTAWFAAETEWWSTRSEAMTRALRGKDPSRAANAVLELGRRRVRRHEAALLLTEGLARPEPQIAKMCCQALGHLRSPLAVPALVGAREHADPTVSEAAGDALARIHEVCASGEAVGAAARTAR